jgi:phospholipid/cholesterol/gamma-HCH transport system permease protein
VSSAAALFSVRGVGGLALLGARSLRAATRRDFDWRESLFQLNELGTRSVALVVSGMTFFGAVMVVVANDQARRLTGNLAIIGPPFVELMVRELGPLTAALLTAARVGASSAAELSAMAVNEQLEALEMSAGDPVRDLVAPRVIASLFGVPLLCVLGITAALASAGLTALWGYGVDARAFVDPRFLDAGDVLCAAVKAVTCGVFIPLAACARGLHPNPGAAGVGEATTDGVVAASLGCLVIDFCYSFGFFLLGI